MNRLTGLLESSNQSHFYRVSEREYSDKVSAASDK